VELTPVRLDLGMEPLLVITNAAAGSAEEDAVDAALRVLRPATDVAVLATEDLDALRAAVRDRDGRRIVAVGGDGSLHAAVQALFDLDALDPAVPLGLIPLGTGNDFARTVGVPLDPAAAATALLTGTPRVLDLAVDESSTVMVNAAHVGIGAEAGRRAHAWKPALGAAAYPLGSVAAGAVETGWRVTVEVDGVVVHGSDVPVLMVGVGNGRTIGGGAPVVPDAAPDDGQLDVVISVSTGPLARAGYAVAMRDGEHISRDDVTVHRGTVVSVWADEADEEFSVNADGEVTGPVRAKTWRLRPAAWSLTVPARD
jgi:YegS/Rv2252/BmrU family lipid kinase